MKSNKESSHPTLYVITRQDEPDNSMCVHPEEFDYECWSFDREELQRVCDELNERDGFGREYREEFMEEECYRNYPEDIPVKWNVSQLPHLKDSYEWKSYNKLLEEKKKDEEKSHKWETKKHWRKFSGEDKKPDMEFITTIVKGFEKRDVKTTLDTVSGGWTVITFPGTSNRDMEDLVEDLREVTGCEWFRHVVRWREGKPTTFRTVEDEDFSGSPSIHRDHDTGDLTVWVLGNGPLFWKPTVS